MLNVIYIHDLNNNKIIRLKDDEVKNFVETATIIWLPVSQKFAFSLEVEIGKQKYLEHTLFLAMDDVLENDSIIVDDPFVNNIKPLLGDDNILSIYIKTPEYKNFWKKTKCDCVCHDENYNNEDDYDCENGCEDGCWKCDDTNECITLKSLIDELHKFLKDKYKNLNKISYYADEWESPIIIFRFNNGSFDLKYKPHYICNKTGLKLIFNKLE